MIRGTACRHGGRVGQRRRSRERGAVAVEFAGLIPFLGIAALLVWQIILVGLTSMFASHAATEGARQAAVTPNDENAIEAEAKKRVSSPWDSDDTFSIEAVERNERLYTVVDIKTPAFLPGVDTPFEIGSEARVVREPNLS